MDSTASPTPGGDDLLDFTGRQVVITGGASGMGAEAVARFSRAGATVQVLDVVSPNRSAGAGEAVDPATPKPVFHRCDLADPGAIDTVAARLPDAIDVLVNCAGVPNGGRFSPIQVLEVNWLGLRHLTESLLARIGRGGAVVHVASTAGRNWAERADVLAELMAAEGFAEGRAWLRSRPELCGDGYVLSKEAVQYYTQWRAVQLLPTGVRMNSVCPGVTTTPILDDFRTGMGDAVIDHAVAVAGRAARPDEMAPAMLFLADHRAASYLNGVNLAVDGGTAAARATDQSDPDAIWGRR